MARPATAAVRLLTGEREPVRLATTSNTNLYGLQTIDGVLTEVGDRVLVKKQSDATKNGIYTASEGQWYRAADARTSRTMQKGTSVRVQQGTASAGKTFVFNTLDPVIEQDAISIGLTSDSYLPAIVANTMLVANSLGTAYFSATPGQVRAYLNIDAAEADGAGINKLAVDMWNGVPVEIECFGDSTMVGYDPNVLVSPFITAEPPTYKLETFLKDYFFSTAITVTNRAVSGSRSSQMLDGTDGSGSTLAAKMAVSTADIVYCNHGINDAQNSQPTPPEIYRANLESFVNICRTNGKVPILQTPNPIYAVPSLGTADKANRQKNYVQIMRDVAENTGTILVDVYNMINSFIRSGNYKVQDAVPDGVHPTAVTYRAIGQLMALPFVHPHAGLAGANQFISIAEGTVTIDPASTSLAAGATRTGLMLISDAISHPKSIKAMIRVDEPGLDIYIGYPIWNGGLAAVGVSWDQVGVGTINQFSSITLTSFEFAQDHEVCVARNVPVGLHMVTLGASSGAASLGLSHIRSRRSTVKKAFTKGSVSSDRFRDLALTQFNVFSSSTDVAMLEDELFISRLLSGEGVDLIFTATMAKDTQFILHGITTAPAVSTAMQARMGVGVGLNGSGFVTVYQLSGENTYATTVLNAVDLSGVAHQWRLTLGAGLSQTMTVYVDGASLGTAALTVPYLGGCMGGRTSGSSKILNITDLRVVEH
ncbi:SGNH/GDSL hydrolase family protein [Mesorhizobium calcicola]|uniref:SGNH/GDSL hydrolase family protein n=1 Tax=Mesorhizobium calcicola TaxID=1300310 RepID=A0ABW4WJ10_9HYPH